MIDVCMILVMQNRKRKYVDREDKQVEDNCRDTIRNIMERKSANQSETSNSKPRQRKVIKNARAAS